KRRLIKLDKERLLHHAVEDWIASTVRNLAEHDGVARHNTRRPKHLRYAERAERDGSRDDHRDDVSQPDDRALDDSVIASAPGKGAGESPQLNGKVARRLKAPIRIFLKSTIDRGLERRRDGVTQCRQTRWLISENRVHRLDRRITVERADARDHLVENGA